MKPYLIGAAVGLLIGLGGGWAARGGGVKVEERIMVETKIRWRTNERIVTLPGATVYRDAQGGMTITGPVEITATRSGEEHIENDISRKTASCPPPPGYTFGASWGTQRDGGTSYGLIAGRRMMGPVWLYGQVIYPPGIGLVTVGVTW